MTRRCEARIYPRLMVGCGGSFFAFFGKEIGLKNIWPIFVMQEEGVVEDVAASVVSGVKEVLEFAGVKDSIKVYIPGVWRSPHYSNGGILRPFRSVDWYVRMGKLASARASQLHADTILYH